jgi:hypothetical protein
LRIALLAGGDAHGAIGFLLKDTPPEDQLQALRVTAAGRWLPEFCCCCGVLP